MVFRDAVLQLSTEHDFVRNFVNSGRLSLPVPYLDSSLNTPDEDFWEWGISPGTNCIDAPVKDNNNQTWLLNYLGWTFKLLMFFDINELSEQQIRSITALTRENVSVESIFINNHEQQSPNGLFDFKGLVAQRYGVRKSGVYLIRPDQYVVGRWIDFDINKIKVAIKRAIGKSCELL